MFEMRLFLIALLFATSVPLLAEDIPVEKFFASDELGIFRISPDGKTACALGLWKGSMNLFAIDLDTREATRITSIKRQNIDSLVWANNTRLVFTLNYDGDENQGLFAVNSDGSDYRVLEKPLLSTGAFVYRYTKPLDRYEKNDEEILVISNHDTDFEFPSVYRLNLYSGRKVLHDKNPGEVTSWYTDWNGETRLAVAHSEQGGHYCLYRESRLQPWKEIARFGFAEPYWVPAVSKGNNSPFSRDGKTVFARSHIESDTAVIQPLDLDTFRLGPILHGDEVYDAASIVQSNYSGGLIGINYNGSRPYTHWFNDEMKLLQSYMEKKLPDLNHVFVNSNLEETKHIVASYSDRVKSVYSLLSITNGKIDYSLISAGQELHPEDLAETRSIRFTARDGLTLHGYLTLPNVETPAKLPMIVHPHGGPWVRDDWGFDSRVQYMANRGFAVLQINFRGSSGYGLTFLHSGDKKWGTDMQNDIVDGVQWAIDEGIADPDRIGIYGASYGGYTTLAQLVLYPELYKFGICSVGPGNLIDLINWRKKLGHDRAYLSYTRTIGDPDTEKDLLATHSPINYMDRLQAPLMIVHGTKDYRVPIRQAIELRKKLDRLGKEYEWVVKKDEGHGFRKPKNKIELYTKMDEFLAPFRDPQ